MRLKDFREALSNYPDDSRVELTRVLSVTDPRNGDKEDQHGHPYIINLDFPIIGLAHKDGDLLLVIEAAPEMIAFGKDIRRLDGTPITDEDMKRIGVKHRG